MDESGQGDRFASLRDLEIRLREDFPHIPSHGSATQVGERWQTSGDLTERRYRIVWTERRARQALRGH